MVGQGSPLQTNYAIVPWIGFMAVLLLPIAVAFGDESADGLRLRLSFGGPQAAVWKGQIELPEGAEPKDVKILGFQKDHAGRIYFKNNLLVIDIVEPTTYGGVEFEIKGLPAAKLKYLVKNIFEKGEDQTVLGEIKLSDLSSSNHSQNIGKSENRIYVERAPGDDLKFISKRRSLVVRNGEPLPFGVSVSPFCEVDFLKEKTLDIKVHKTDQPKNPEWTESIKVEEKGQLVEFTMDAQLDPGVYDMVMQIKEPSRIPFSAPTVLKQRKVQFVVVSAVATKPFSDTEDNLELIYENVAGKAEKVFRGRFKPWEKLNASARKLIFNHLPLPSKGNDSLNFFEIKPESLQLFPLTVDPSQSLLKVEVEFVSPTSMVSDFVLFDRAQTNHRYSEVVSVTRKVDPSKPPKNRCEFVFWNKSQNPVLMVRNLKGSGNLKINKIRVYRFAEKAQEFKLYTEHNRRLFAKFSTDRFERLIGAPKAKQENNYFLDDWNTFRTGGLRLIQLVKSAQYQGVVLDVNDGSNGIFPSQFLQFLPKNDTGIFSAEGKDPYKKDVLELLLCQFDANGLTLIPRIELPEYVAAFDSADAGFQKNIRLVRADGSISRTYNYLNPHVQSYIAQAIEDVAKRYSHHPSFGGICLNLGANGQLLLGKNNGYNDQLVDEFLNQNPIKLVSAKTAAEKRNLIASTHAIEFRKHQTSLATNFLVDLNKKINSICGKNLTLDLTDLYHSDDSNQLFPKLRKGTQLASLMEITGVNKNELTKAGIGILMPSLSNASLNHSESRVDYALRETTSQNADLKNHSITRSVERRVEAANQKVASTAFEGVIYHASRPDSNHSFRKDLVEQLAQNELLFFVDEFELGQRSLNSSSKRVWNTYCSLPNTVFDTVNKESTTSPVIVRTKSIGDNSFFYVINQSPWPTKVRIVFGTPIVNLRSVDGNFFDSLVKSKTGGELELALEPYDLVGCRSDQKELKISDVQYSFPESLSEQLTKQKDLLLAKIRFAKTPVSLVKEFNPGFEGVDKESIPVNWNFASAETFKADTVFAEDSETNRHLRIENKSDEKWGWVRSQFLANRGTGRLSVLVSLKMVEDQPSPKLRLSVDGVSNGTEYYRFGSFSAEASQPEAARIEKDWKVFAVHFNDVPTDIQKLRVGLDVVGKGSILVDDVKVLDRWFDAQDKEALTKLVSLAAHNISTGDYLKAYNLMNGYWPRFLQAYEPQVERR